MKGLNDENFKCKNVPVNFLNYTIEYFMWNNYFKNIICPFKNYTNNSLDPQNFGYLIY